MAPLLCRKLIVAGEAETKKHKPGPRKPLFTTEGARDSQDKQRRGTKKVNTRKHVSPDGISLLFLFLLWLWLFLRISAHVCALCGERGFMRIPLTVLTLALVSAMRTLKSGTSATTLDSIKKC
jgi:hypothetical protein